MSPSIAVNIITGALGAGKTTAIARLLATKPSQERWVVILNEMTDAGIDALTVASAAVGAYDVRAIPGGCLCCTGEEDFQQQLGHLVLERPTRILIEPSGIAHPGAVIDELRVYERAGSLQLLSTIVLLDAPRLHVLTSPQLSTEREQVEVADVLLLSKAELATHDEQQQFLSAASNLFPPKRWIGLCASGNLPVEALQPPSADFSFESMASAGRTPHRHASPHAHRDIVAREFAFRRSIIQARTQHLLGRWACGWNIPSEVIFDKQRWGQVERSPLMEGVERLKAVLRMGIEHRLLIQCDRGEFSLTEVTWRQESRIEVQMKPGCHADWPAWDRLWLGLMEETGAG